MPYQSIADINPSLKGIRPRIILAQANEIAAMADAIVPDNPKGAWAIAISNFKKRLYVVRGGRWVKRQNKKPQSEVAEQLYTGEGERHRNTPEISIELDDEPMAEAATVKTLAQRLARDITLILRERTLPAPLRKEIEDVRAALKRTWADLAADTQTENDPMAEMMKTIGGKDYPASDFLVVEDKDSPTTWHLQVMRNGKPDHNLMGAAMAALTIGYRGNKYEGPKKGAAITKLKALYKSEEMEMPATESAKVAEHDGVMPMAMPNTTFGAKTFADLDAAYNAQEAASEAHERVYQFQTLVTNILNDALVMDKVAAIKTIADEFVSLIGELFATPTEPPTEESAPIKPTLQAGESEFAESESGVAFALIEEGAPSDNGNRAPVTVDFVMIKPGAGNQKDRHYYPADVLRRDAHVFEGADIFTTDHIDAQRSERTKVGKVKAIKEFTAEGAPIARAILFDPDTAEKTRNRARAGELATLECSILGNGIAKPKEINGEKYNVVEELTRGIALELVSKAGAGGHARNIAEGGEPVGTQPTIPDKPVETPGAVTPPPAPTPAPVQETNPPEPTVLAEADTQKIIGATNLPVVIREWLAEGKYATEKELTEAIERATERTKKLIDSGAPFAQGKTTLPASTQISEADHQKALDEIDRRYGIKH